MDDHPSSTGVPPLPAPNRPHPDDGRDYELVRRIGFADRAALKQLYFDYHERLVKFLFRAVHRHEDLEQVVNDTFLIVWQQAGEFRGASRVSTWIFGIAYRCALKTIRLSSVRARGAVLSPREGEAKDAHLLELGIASLSPEQRLVIALAYCGGYSCEEIAAIVACSVSTVKWRMWQARRKLRAISSAAAAPQGTFLGIDGAGAQTQDLELS